jgi:hypothetical protein
MVQAEEETLTPEEQEIKKIVYNYKHSYMFQFENIPHELWSVNIIISACMSLSDDERLQLKNLVSIDQIKLFEKLHNVKPLNYAEKISAELQILRLTTAE